MCQDVHRRKEDLRTMVGVIENRKLRLERVDLLALKGKRAKRKARI